MGHLWHPFADMRSVEATGEFVIERGEGYHVFDDAGQRYVDATASLWYANAGHGQDTIIRAVHDQMSRLETYSTFGDFANFPAIELAERLSMIAPVPDSVSFFTSGGSDSIETAVKLARRYFHVIGQPQRKYFLARHRSYHGMHTAGTSIGGIPPNQEGHGELLADVRQVEWDSVDALAATIDDLGSENIAAFLCEPIIGAGGVLVPPNAYLEKTRSLCREAGIIFIADEVVTGFGRTGSWFASERFGLEPDLITCAKGLTSGYLPMGAVIVSPWLAEPFFKGHAGMWRHGYTYSGHATVAAAALANLDIVEGLLGHAESLEKQLAKVLETLHDHELVGEVRAGTGVLGAVELRSALVEADPSLPQRVITACRANGVLSRMLVGNAIHVSPPLVIDGAGLLELAGGLRKALDECLQA